MKTLTNLTPLGPDDGGTTVIPGSHKVAVEDRQAVSDPPTPAHPYPTGCRLAPSAQIIDAAYGDPERLIHTVVAPPGSTLLFGEALIHASGQIRSDRRRCIIIGGTRDPASLWMPRA